MLRVGILAALVADEDVSGVHSFDPVTPHHVPPERRLDRSADLTDTQRGDAPPNLREDLVAPEDSHGAADRAVGCLRVAASESREIGGRLESGRQDSARRPFGFRARPSERLRRLFAAGVLDQDVGSRPLLDAHAPEEVDAER